METKEFKKRKSQTSHQEKKDKMTATKKLRKAHEEEDEKRKKDEEDRKNFKSKDIEDKVNKELEELEAKEAKEEQDRKDREERAQKEGDEKEVAELEAKLEAVGNKFKTLSGGTVYANEETLVSREGYTIDRTDVAQGHFSKVYKAHKDGKDMYLKIILLQNHVKQTIDKIKESLKVGQYLKDNSHQNVVRIYDVFSTKDNKCYVFMEPCDGDIKSRLKTSKSDRAVAKKWALNVGEGLAFLHANAIAHRNLTPENIMIDAKGTCKVGGMSVSVCYYDSDKRERVKLPHSTDYYPHYAPERIKEPYEPSAADVFNFGVLIMQLITGNTPFILKGPDASTQPLSIQWKLCLALNKVDLEEELLDLFSKLFEEDPSKRQRMRQVMKHSFFKT